METTHLIIITCIIFMSTATAGHALLYKRDPRAALGWIGVCLMFPVAGPLLYFLFGINRVRTRAQKLHRRSLFRIQVGYERSVEDEDIPPQDYRFPQEVSPLARISTAVTRRPLVGGNQVTMLHNGEEVYPAMLGAIEGASESVFLATYIFESNSTGRRFIDALARAAARGVDVKVLIDGIGELYTLPRAGSLLERRGVRIARFIPPKLLPPTLHINLRNHRKVMVVDRHVGFVGGMNIGDRHLAERLDNPGRVVDSHFRLTGPVISQIEQVFLEDWAFSTGERVVLPAIAVPREGNGGATCRTIVDGPNEDLNKLATILVGIVSSARSRIYIMTPYFLPSGGLIAALQAAALRGVQVVIVLPAKNNLPFVHWATQNMLWELLQWGVHVYFQPSPFVHTKLLLVDDHYAQIGSANVDSRSLRLNFELVIEVFDFAFSKILAAHFDKALSRSREVTLKEMDGRSLPVRTRDALSWLFSPYL